MQTLCENLKSKAIVSSEIKSVKERYSRSRSGRAGPGVAGSGRFTSKTDFWVKNETFFIYDIFSLKLIFKKFVRYFQTHIFEVSSLRNRQRRRIRLLRSK